jgi:hypothetical protein
LATGFSWWRLVENDGACVSDTRQEYHLIVARDTRIIREDEFATLVAQTISVRKMLYTLIKRLPTTSVKRARTNATPKSQ